MNRINVFHRERTSIFPFFISYSVLSSKNFTVNNLFNVILENQLLLKIKTEYTQKFTLKNCLIEKIYNKK